MECDRNENIGYFENGTFRGMGSSAKDALDESAETAGGEKMKYVNLDDLLKMQMPIYIRTGRHDVELFQQTDGVTRYAIDKLETVTEQDFSRKGEWKPGYSMMSNNVVDILKCSRCRTGYQTLMAEEWMYCPNCGAKMDGRS